MKKSVRWLPALLAPVLVVSGALAVPAIANAASTPPTKSAQQVLALIAGARDAAYSGTIEQQLRSRTPAAAERRAPAHRRPARTRHPRSSTS